MKKYTRFSASVASFGPSGQYNSPLVDAITDDNCLMFANNGTLLKEPTPELRAKADEIRRRLESGETVTTKTATIMPLQ